jgi:hypothetical protein
LDADLVLVLVDCGVTAAAADALGRQHGRVSRAGFSGGSELTRRR